MRIAVTVVIEMTDEQAEAYANEYGLDRTGTGRLMTKTVVEDVRGLVLSTIQGTLDGIGSGADVSLKRAGR